MPNNTDETGDAVITKSLRENSFGSIKISHQIFAQSKFAPGLVRFINKYLYPLGVGGILNRYDSSLALYSAKKDKDLYRGFANRAIFVNFGSGAFHHPRWENYDYPGVSEYYKSIQGAEGKDFHPIDLCVEDLTLPYESGTVSLIYCAHTLEHLEESKALRFLSECARILGPSGVLRIAVPNTDSDFEFSRIIYSQQSVDENQKTASIRSSVYHLFSPADALSDDLLLEDVTECQFVASRYIKMVAEKRGLSGAFDPNNPGSHISHWNHAKLASVAVKSGFKCYLPLYRGSSTQPPFRNIDVFDTTEPHISLYGEFIGPSTD